MFLIMEMVLSLQERFTKSADKPEIVSVTVPPPVREETEGVMVKEGSALVTVMVTVTEKVALSGVVMVTTSL